MVAEALRNDEVGDGGHETRCRRRIGRTEGRGTANATDRETTSWRNRGVVVVVDPRRWTMRWGAVCGRNDDKRW